MTKILLVEDNDEIRENTAEILELANYDVVTAPNGKAGYEELMRQPFDLVICDIMMPVLDGYGLLHLVNKNVKLRGIPFIFLTAKTERNDFRKGMEMGADDYITKPFHEIELLNAIESRLKKANYNTGQQTAQVKANDLPTLEGLLDNAGQNTYRKKQIVYGEGNHPHTLYFIKSGKVRTYKTNDFGKELTVNLYNQGDFFGYQALLQNTVYKETAETLEDSEILLLSREDIDRLIHGNPKVASKFIQLLASHVQEKEDQLLSMAYNSLRKRVADALVTLLKKYGTEHEKQFTIQISREDLAHIAGTTTESLIRTLSDFKSEKLIEAEAGSVKILNEKKLLQMIN